MYAASSDCETFVIGKAVTTTTVTCTAGPFSYTGSAIAPCSATATGANGLNQALTVSYTDNVNAGTVTASASYGETGNYAASSDSKTFVIGKAVTTTTVTCTAVAFTYAGSPITAASAMP